MADLDHWTQRAGQDAFATHARQLERLVAPMRAAVDETVPADPSDGAANAANQDLWRIRYQLVHCLWSIWEHFRDKLDQRGNAVDRAALALADDLVWELWSPTVDDEQAPPLVYADGLAGPVMFRRGERFGVEMPSGIASMVADVAAGALRALPVPLIGLPFHDLHHPPAFVTLAHEVGHVVETQVFASLDELQSAVAGAVPDVEADAWRVWSREAFADIVGARLLGPVFPEILFDYLSADVQPLDASPDAGHDYPSPAQRMALCWAVLKKTGHDTDAQIARWHDAFGGDAARSAWETGAETVDAVIDAVWPKLAKLPMWTPQREKWNATKVVPVVTAGGLPNLPKASDTVVAAARSWLADPAKFVTRQADAETRVTSLYLKKRTLQERDDGPKGLVETRDAVLESDVARMRAVIRAGLTELGG